MLRALAVLVRSITYAALLAVAPASALAQQPGEQVEGVITEVDGRSMTVDRGGKKVTARLAARTHVVVQPRQGGHYPNASPEFLKAGMSVRFRWADGPLDRVHVTAVPAGAWPEATAAPATPAPRPSPRAGDEQVLKVRIAEIARSGESFTADVAGRKRVFLTRRPSLLRAFRVGDLVVVSLAGDGTVVDVRAASLAGRVVAVDTKARRLVVEVEGREQSYAVDDRDLLEGVQAGDRIRFEVEERGPGRQVVTAIY
jgi:hypothetical protein